MSVSSWLFFFFNLRLLGVPESFESPQWDGGGSMSQ